MTPRLPILTATFAGILVAPMLAFGQATAPTTAPTGPPAATVQAPATVTIQVAPGAATAPATPASRTTLPTHAGAERRATQIIGASI